MIEMIRQLGLFIVAAQTILHLAPDKRYEKYIRLVASVILVALLMKPVAGLVKVSGADGKGDWLKEELRLEEELQEIQDTDTVEGMDWQKRVEEIQELQMESYTDSIIEEIKSKVNNIATKEGYTVEKFSYRWQDSAEDQSGTEEDAGELWLSVSLSRTEDAVQKRTEGTLIQIEPVMVGREVVTEGEKSSREQENPQGENETQEESREKELAQQIMEHLGEENVHVQVQISANQ